VAILAIVLLALWFGIGAPLCDWYAERTVRLNEQRMLAAHMAELAATLPSLARQVGTANTGTSGTGQGAAQVSDTDALVAAGMQQRLMRLAAQAGIEIASAETLPAEQHGGLRHIGLRVTLLAPWPDLMKLLAAIETDTPPLLIDDLDLRADAGGDSDWPKLQAQFSVIALRDAGSSAATP
jgi:general secretion pathway protein M